MDQQLAEWQRQAQEAIQQQPEKKDAIMAMYNDDIRKYLEDQKRMAQKAIDEQGKPDYVISQFKQMLEDNKDVISFDKDLDYSKMFDVRPMQFRDTRSGVSSTADLPYEQGKFDGETPEEYYDRLERDSGGGHGAFSPFRLEEEEKAAAAQEEARRKARESLSFTGKLAADAEGFGKSLLSGGFRAGSAAGGILGGVLDAAGTAIDPVGAAHGFNPMRDASDWMFNKSQEASEASKALSESIPQESSDASGVAGQIIPMLAGGFAVEPFAQGADVLDSGGSLTKAQLMSAKQGAINVAGLASGMLGSQARGVLPLLSRGAAQVPTNIALGAVDRKLSGQEYTNEDMAMDAAFGAFGSIFRNADTPRVSDVLEDGPPAKAGEIDFSGDKGRVGESKDPPVFGEIVPTKTVIEDTGTASAREVDRISLMERAANALPSTEAKALAKENIANSKEARTLQKELDQLPTEQELYSKLSGEYFVEDVRVHGPEGANDPRLTKLRNDSALEEAKRQRENLRKPIADELADVSDRLQRTEQLSAKAADGQAALDQLRRVERQEKSGKTPTLRNPIPQRSTTEASFPSQGEGVTVSVTPAKAARAPSAVSSVSPTTKFNYTIGKDGTLSNTLGRVDSSARSTPAPQSITQLEQLIRDRRQAPSLEDLDHSDRSVVEDSTPTPLSSESPSPSRPLPMRGDAEGRGIKTPMDSISHLELEAGGLTVGNFLDRLSSNEGKAYDRLPQTRGMSRIMQTISKAVSADDIKIIKLDKDNPEHLSFKDKKGQSFAHKTNGAAFYDPSTDTVYLSGESPETFTVMHEIVHALTTRAMRLGASEKLPPKQQQAFRQLEDLYKEYLPELKEQAAKYKANTLDGAYAAYGLQNIREFIAEFMSNPFFRETLRNIPIKKTRGDSISSKIKNLYDAVQNKIAKVLGLPPSATSALDLFSHSVDNFTSTLDEASRTTRWDSRNATRSGIDPSLDVQGEQRALRPQRNRLLASAKAGVAGRGLEPILTNARETLSGDKQEARLRQVTLVNKSIGALEGMGEATKSRVFELLGELESNSASPKSREQFAELKTLSPEIATMAKELLNDRFTNSGVLSNLLLESMKKSGKFDQKTANIALKIMENSNSWKPSVYDSKEATLRRRKSALRAEKKLKEKKLLSDEEKDDLAKWQNLNTWIRNTTYGNAEQLKKLSTNDLRAIYEASIKDAPSLKGLDKDAQRDLMIGYISDYNSKIVDIDQAVRNLADSIAGFGGSRDPLIKYFNGLKYDSGVLATKEQVPKVIREFWGEITNPLLRLIEGHTKQLLQISQVKALNSLRESGLGTLFTDRVDTHMNTRMQGSNYGALEGLYTTPEIHQAMGDIMDFGRQATGVMDSLLSGRDLTNTSLAGMEKVLWAWVNATRAVKTSTTVLNAGAWWRNLEGSALQVVSNGNINPASYAKGMEAMTGLVGITQKSSVNPLSAKMIKLGLGEASQIADTYSAKNTRALDVLKTILDEHPEASPGKVRKLLDAGGHTKDVVKELYGALDLWTKFANFFNDLEQVREFNKRNDIEMSEQQLERYVADRTKQTNITYSRSPKVLKVLESLGNTQFANYYYEVFRTSLNNVGLGIQDMLKGIKYGDAAYTAHGLKRLVGTATAITAGTAMYTAITKATMAALGLAATEEADKKEIEAYRKESGFQDPTTSLEFKDPNTGGIFSFDAASINPYDPMAKVVLPALKAIADPANADEYGAEIAKNMGNLINRTPLIGGVTKALSGKSPSLKNTSPAAYDALVDMGVNGLGISVDTMDRVINATNALVPKQIKEAARAVSTEGSLSTKLAIGSGAGVYEVSPEKDVTNFLGPAFQAQLREAKEDYKDLMTSRIPVTKGALDKRFLQAIKDIAKPYASLDKAVKAQVALGRSKEDIIRAMMGKNVEKSVAQMLYEGKATPALIVYDNMLDTAKAEIKQLDNRPKEQQAAEDRWQKKLSAIEEIATKYSKYSFEEIEEL